MHSTDYLHTDSLIPLEEVKEDRYLGVTLNSKLNFNQHIDGITNRAMKILNLCRRNLHMCDNSKMLIKPLSDLILNMLQLHGTHTL